MTDRKTSKTLVSIDDMTLMTDRIGNNKGNG